MNKKRKVFVVLLGLFLALAWTALPVSAVPSTQEDRKAQADALFDEGMGLYNVGKYQAALEKFQAALEIYREIGELKREGWTLNNIGVVYESLGQYQEALKYYKEALAIKRELGDRAGEGETLGNIGIVYGNLGQYQEALKYYEESLVISREIGNRAGEGDTLNNIGVVYESLGQYQEALKYYQEALVIKREIGDRRGEGDTLGNIGIVYGNLGQYQEALKYYEEALAIRREIGDRRGEGVSLNNIGVVYWNLGQYQEALRYLEESLAIFREIGYRRGEGISLNGIGLVYENLGQYQEALRYHEEALAIFRELGYRAGEGDTLGNIGIVYETLGQYQEALKVYEEALVISRELGYRVGEGATLNNIGVVYWNLGQYQEALRYYEEALAIFRELGDRKEEGISLSNIGLIYKDLKQYQEALKHCEEALAISREIGDRKGEGDILNIIGEVYRDVGQYQEALRYFEEALAIKREIGDREWEGKTLNNTGEVYHDLGQYQEALKYYEEALVIRREIGDRPGEASTLDNMGQAHYGMGEKERALEFYLEALALYEEIRGAITVEELKTAYAETYKGLYERIISLQMELNRPGEAFHTGERARARAFLDQLGNQRVDVRSGADAALLTQEATLRGEMAALESSLRQEWDKPQAQRRDELIESIATQLESKRGQYEKLLTQLKLQNPEYASLVSVDPLTLGEVQGLLDEQTALIEYFVTEEKTLAFVVTHDGLEVIEIEVARDELVSRVSYLREVIPLRQSEAEQESAQGLYDLLIKPLITGATHFPSASHLRLGIVPHGPLHYLPFAALRDGDTYLIQKHTLFFLPSASVLQFVLGKRKPGADTLLALGNPATDLPALPFAQEEAQAIAGLYGTRPFTGDEASESQLRAQAGGYGLVHIAAHGSFNPYNSLFSALHLAAEGEHDGRLEVHEVYGLDLAQADLVVLSACDTQLGQLSEGDELIGLNRAFIYAGTSSIVASLWPVDDAATADLMEGFYRRMREGYSKAEALRAVQMEMMEEKGDAYYWAGFSLVGDWGTGEEIEIEVEVEATATPAEAVTGPTSTPSSTPAIEVKATVTPTEVVAEPTAAPAEKGGGLCGGSAALLMVGLVGLWLRGGQRWKI